MKIKLSLKECNIENNYCQSDPKFYVNVIREGLKMAPFTIVLDKKGTIPLKKLGLL